MSTTIVLTRDGHILGSAPVEEFDYSGVAVLAKVPRADKSGLRPNEESFAKRYHEALRKFTRAGFTTPAWVRLPEERRTALTEAAREALDLWYAEPCPTEDFSIVVKREP